MWGAGEGRVEQKRPTCGAHKFDWGWDNVMDATYAEILVILDVAFEERINDAVEMLKAAGMSVDSADDDSSVVGGQVDVAQLHTLEHLACVDYVRKVFTYDANFPPGDPRDRDGR